MCITDARSGFLHNAYLCTVKDNDSLYLDSKERKTSKPSQSVICLHMQHKSNVTANNWFRFIKLVNAPAARGFTYLGTVKEKVEIPPQFLPNKIEM